MLSEEDLQSLPFEIVRARGETARETWQELRQRGGVVPVLLGNDAALQRWLDAEEYDPEDYPELEESVFDPHLLAERGLRLDVNAWIADTLRDHSDRLARWQVPTQLDVPWHGAGMTDARPGFHSAYDLRGRPYAEVFFALVPVAQPWLVPAHLPLGGWNDCPDPEVHIAFCHRWFERYGAVVTAVCNDGVEFMVERPPTAQSDARQLALEHFAYCDEVSADLFQQYAASLLNKAGWSFWWD